jgi:hypothetical protein
LFAYAAHGLPFTPVGETRRPQPVQRVDLHAVTGDLPLEPERSLRRSVGSSAS